MRKGFDSKLQARRGFCVQSFDGVVADYRTAVQGSFLERAKQYGSTESDLVKTTNEPWREDQVS